MEEIWAPAFEYEGLYEVSNLGRVKRLAGTPKCPNERLLKAVPLKRRHGYLVVSLWKNGKGLPRRVNRLVYQSFRGAVDAKIDIHHRNDVNTNNELANLQALTKLEHSAVTAHPCGEAHHGSILKVADVNRIRKEYRKGVRGSGYRAIAIRMGIRSEYVRDVIKGKTWSHLT